MSKSYTDKMGTPLNGRILVKPDDVEAVTSFGLILTPSKEKPQTGVVVIGNDSLKEGDRILFSLFGLDEIKLNGEIYAVVSDTAVLFKYAQ